MSNQDSTQNQGEGDKESARHYNDAQRQFVKAGKVDQAAHDAAPKDDADAQQMQQAEQAGRSHAKDEDPTVPGANAAHRQQK
jgi:hypothetical protein